ncbi:MAG: RsbRD N-terminal domain-containing protein [Dissulfurimicrobium sp.]|uniref:RsbRD N-terminal domain-containing protein n=1 Tax=Dissulfurimicrobium TaxID=1769732 RepID=UPI003C734F7D
MMNNLLHERLAVIEDRWIRLIAATYPPETAKFLLGQKDRFANPVGYTILNAAGPILEEILKGGDPENVKDQMDEMMRIRAVQDFEPSGAVSVFYLLKKAIRDEIRAQDLGGKIKLEDILSLESKIDKFVLMAFDVYMKCRERVWEIKLNDIMKRPFVLSEVTMCPSYLIKKGMFKDIGLEKDINNQGLS